MSLTANWEKKDMLDEKDERGDVPLYVKVPATVHDYLNSVKEETGITKTDAVTLIMEIATKFFDPETINDMYSNYMLLGDDGLDLSDICERYKS